MDNVRVVGVHPVAARDSVHLIEIDLTGAGSFDFGQITQKVSGQPRENWQVAYDEREVEGKDSRRFAFFFHFLNVSLPPETAIGPLSLPAPSPVPDHLKHISYEEP